MPAVLSGLEALLDDPHPWIRGQRLGLLCNPASIDRHYVHARHLRQDAHVVAAQVAGAHHGGGDVHRGADRQAPVRAASER